MQITPEEKAAVYKTIYARRDTRSEFVSKPIPEEILHRILDAAHHAPSVGFMQPWDFIIIHNDAIKLQIKQAFEVSNREAMDMFEGERQEQYCSLKLEGITEAPLGICITCDRERTGNIVLGKTANPEMDLYSTVCAVQTLWLAARAENLGVGWVSIIHHDALKRILGIPEKIVPVAYLCLGYVSHYHEKPELEEKGWQSRLELDSLIHKEKW